MRKLLLLSWTITLSLLIRAQVSEIDQSIAMQLVQKNSAAIGLSANDLDNSIVSGTYIIPGSDIRMVYLQQSFRSIPVYNKLHVLAFKNEKAVSVAGHRIASVETKTDNDRSAPVYTAIDAVRTAAADCKVSIEEMIVPSAILQDGRKFEFGRLGISSERIFAELMWFPLEENGPVKLAWQVFIAPLKTSDYWLIRVDALTNKVISKENMTISCNWGDGHHSPKEHFTPNDKKQIPAETTPSADKAKMFSSPSVVNNATYRVIKYPAESPQHPGGGHQLVTNPWTMTPGNATTHGWHFDGTVYYDSTRGNNAFAYDDRDANNLPGRSGLSSTPQPDLLFDFAPDYTLEPVVRTPAPNQQFNTTNLFYWNNLMHDLSYVYGFTETARNYQNDNMGRGGKQGDYVLAEAQDGSGTNNANFSSGVDGTRGRMQMYLWTAPTPDRDGDVDNGIIAHEYTHGISNRMTATGSGCLSNQEQMGEGWSDYLALMITHDWATATPPDGFNNPRGIGTYALNQPVTGPGIRQYRYTTNMAINPMTYANLPSVAVPHGVGTIWCTALWDMTWEIIQQAGINPNLFNPAGTGGNSIALKLVIEGLRLQPCSPGFISGRDAILKADTLFFGSQYSCAIIRAFARRGMGLGASQGSSNVRGDETITFVNADPAITAHPQNASVCSGNNTTFSITATGLNLSYQWQVSTDGGITYNNISGATSSGYTITGVTTGMNNNRYRCIVSGCPPSVTSNAAILTVGNGPAVSSQPANTAVCENSNASFSISGTGGSLSYQWQLSTDGGANYNNITGATNATLNLTAVTVSMNNNRYRCILSTPTCGVPATSNAAILTVNLLAAITSQPTGATLCSGGNNTLCITAAGTNLVYIWEYTTNCATAPWQAVPNTAPYSGINTPCLTITNAPAALSGYGFRCVVSSVACGNIVFSTCATITVITPVAISSQPADAAVCSGSSATFSVTGSSTQTINYQWQVSTDGGTTWGNITGANTSSYTTGNTTTAMSNNRYRCQLSNAACAAIVNSNSALLTVRQLPAVSLSAAPLTSLLPGKTTTLTATATASTGGTLTTNWFFNSNAISNTGNERLVNVEQVGAYQVRIQESWPGGLVCSAQSAIVAIDATPSPKLFIFPSPNDGNFKVAYYNNGGASTQRTIAIFDSKGSMVYNRQFSISGPYTIIPIDLQRGSRGIYYVVVGDAGGKKLITGKVHVR